MATGLTPQSAFLVEQGFPVRCVFVSLAQEPTETGFRMRIVDRCPELPTQRVRGVYVCDEHATEAQSGSRATVEGVM
jgi:hypothetical protein